MEKWDTIQKNADQILSDGMYELLRQPYRALNYQVADIPGNYLISLDGKGMYVGESLDIAHRLKQQAKPATSTFYKNYLKYNQWNPRNLMDFQVQVLQTMLERKELEEFCIVNVPTPLNKFQLEKKNRLNLKDMKRWNDIQLETRSILDEGMQKALSSPKYKWSLADIPEKGGVYLIFYKNELLYVGETSCILERIKTHSEQTYFSAFRRNCGTALLGFTLKTKNGKKRYFTDEEDRTLDLFLKECLIIPFPVGIGRGELEEYLINKFLPVLNKKGV